MRTRIRGRWRAPLGCALAAAAVLAALARPVRAQEAAPVRPPRPASYAFATELGSGVYEVDGRTLQIYRLPFHRVLRRSAPDAPGWRLTAPVTLGFFDFGPRDVVEARLPRHLDSFSFVPGLELEFLMSERWRLLPYARAGASFASGELDAWLYGAGLRSEFEWEPGEWLGRLRTDLAHAAIDSRGDVPNDDFSRLRVGLEMRRGTGPRLRGRELEVGLYWLNDLFVDTPRPPGAHARASMVQVEPGIVLGLRPPARLRRFALPRVGLGYRYAGDLSGWHFVIGAPF